MLYIVLAFFVGLIFGYVLPRRRKNKSIGYLRVDHSDPSDAPFLFLELEGIDIPTICKQREVILKVKREDFIPHE